MSSHIADMLRSQKKHISFHTPGHKRGGADITELSYSDCLLSPTGVLAEAERDITEILGAARSFLLTDGSTCGVFSMLAAAREGGVKRVAAPVFSHPCVKNGCEILGLELVIVPQDVRAGIPLQPQPAALKTALEGADALVLTSPDYYGFLAPLEEARALCTQANKPLIVDGAHGAHLHFCPSYAGNFADMWVDGVHKSLPALTQGAVVSANAAWAERLGRNVRKFRTTSPSYPIMASVEYAVKYPRNRALEWASEAFKREFGCVQNDDWTKILIPFEDCNKTQAALEQRGLYPEFNDRNYLMFYLSPCSDEKDLRRLGAVLPDFARREVPSDAPAGAIPMYRDEP